MCRHQHKQEHVIKKLFPIIVYVQISQKFFGKSFTMSHSGMYFRGRRPNQILLVSAFAWKVERFISSSYSCQADLKLWNFRDAWLPPELPSSRTEVKLSKTRVQSNKYWFLRITIHSAHVYLGLLCSDLFLNWSWIMCMFNYYSTPPSCCVSIQQFSWEFWYWQKTLDGNGKSRIHFWERAHKFVRSLKVDTFFYSIKWNAMKHICWIKR